MSLLNSVTKGRVMKPYYLLMHGLPGIGKSSFAAGAPNPIFLCAEEGTSHLDVSRLELTTFGDFIQALKELHQENHDYKTLVVDTLDHVEPLIFAEVCKDKGKRSIEDIGYAKGYIWALDYWQELIKACESLRSKKNMNVIFLAHTEVKTFNDPQLSEGYDRYQVKLHHKASTLIIDRVEDVLFANYKAFIHKEGDTAKAKALGDGSRVIFTEHRPAFQAKNRHELPFEMPLSWSDYELYTTTEKDKSPAALLENINTLLGSIDPDMKKKIESHLEKIKEDSQELLKVENRLRTMVQVA